MRIAITTYGSRGDHQPYIALAKRLLDDGHEVKLGGSPVDSFAATARSVGVAYHPLGPSYDAESFSDAIEGVLRATTPAEQTPAS